MEWHQVLIRPLITEKGTAALEDTESKLVCYPFEVHKQATKDDIKEAVRQMAQELFDREVDVKKVNTMNTSGKTRRRGKYAGVTRGRKKAFIFIPSDQRIEII
ncbi:MAG: 50S ribosomal protein L23 [Planctomycetota bacterium]|jgi:large subunit ribosomal protein L23|nr:50S ribosomal protein L23 [Planctomycetota bacterium]MDP6359735.1 50S ribosomal protein L23 [Planctomycetota bacterium]MDP6507179.1 50S ribosomal protein L23 [Planctomycetota bacterium]MDP7130605.1 50S ribosomal protein L23 [Planctomycetota bacterium]MDP7251724.1 50S ribosomal protein L23 [Planctomycetota bacterium]